MKAQSTCASSQLGNALLRAHDGRMVRCQVRPIDAKRALEKRQGASGVAAELRRDAHVEHGVCAVPVVRTLRAGA